MRAVVQRVTGARVTVAGEELARIDLGLLVLLGVAETDTRETARRLADKVAALRIFEDREGKMNLAASEVGGAVLCVSQFTLLGDVRRGRRPSFTAAARPEAAEPLWAAFCLEIEAAGLRCGRGRFGAEMAVELVNDGPVTLIIDSEELDQPRRA